MKRLFKNMQLTYITITHKFPSTSYRPLKYTMKPFNDFAIFRRESFQVPMKDHIIFYEKTIFLKHVEVISIAPTEIIFSYKGRIGRLYLLSNTLFILSFKSDEESFSDLLQEMFPRLKSPSKPLLKLRIP